MEKKPSSIEWLVDQFKEYDFSEDDGMYLIKIPSWLLAEKEEKAKAMHKEEIEDAWLNGMKGEMIAPLSINNYKPDAEEYYNETFEGDTGVIVFDNIHLTNTNKINNGGSNE